MKQQKAGQIINVSSTAGHPWRRGLLRDQARRARPV